jgi:formylglycine-generating enzyme required for sulfatase activity
MHTSTPSPPPSTDLEKLQQLARSARKDTPEHTAEERRKKRGPSPRRIFIWILEAFVLVTVLQTFLITPWMTERRAKLKRAPVAETLPAPLDPIGDNALQLTGLTEVIPAYPPKLEGLDMGSDGAFEAQLAYAREHGLPVEVENSVGIRFRLIPPGTFVMGSPEHEKNRWEGEKQHVATIKAPFYMSKYEITQAQWTRVMETNPSYFQGKNRPVEEITWHDCMRFALKLAEVEGLPKGTYRLPGEAEWEYACRAGTEGPFCFGNDPNQLKDFAVFINNSDGRSQAVGKYRPNAFGLYGMHGNLWEWCFDTYINYPGVDAPGPTDGQWRVIRGGNWRDLPKDCRSAERSRLPPDSLGNLLGLRLVRTIPEMLGH